MQGTPERQSATERNEAVVRRFIEEVQNKKDMDVFDELNAPNFVNLSAPPGMPTDREGGKMFLGGFLSAFPDSHVTIDDMIAEGDRVATKKTFTGTHTGAFGELAATGIGSRFSTSTSSACATARSSNTG
jgi:predicted ester cyclase